MARSRNIKPGLYKNEDLAECSIWARFLFPGLWMLADREGRLEDRPKRIKGELLPFDSQDVEPLLRELEAASFLIRYEVGGVSYIQISKFTAHQTPHYTEKGSVIPPPDSWSPPVIINDDSKKQDGIKEGSKPPDSLIPDSPIPSNPPLPPDGGKKPAVSFQTFIDACKASGEKPISTYAPVWDYAKSIGLPAPFIELAWWEFRRQMSPGGTSAAKRQKDWRATFRNYVEKGYLKLWTLGPDGQFKLTSAGQIAERATKDKE